MSEICRHLLVLLLYMNIDAVVVDGCSRSFPALVSTLPLGTVFLWRAEDVCKCNAAEGT